MLENLKKWFQEADGYQLGAFEQSVFFKRVGFFGLGRVCQGLLERETVFFRFFFEKSHQFKTVPVEGLTGRGGA